MSNITLGLVSFAVLLAMVFLRIPIGLSMFLCGVGGSWIITGSPAPMLGQLKQIAYSTFSDYNLSVVPLFLLMGQFAAYGGISGKLFATAENWLGHRRGGLAMATIGACAGFGAICGSSMATAATMARVALPELRRAGYSGALSTGTLAAGGTLGILIPPSIILVIYATLTEQNIAKLFVAAFVPGLLAAIGYMIAIRIFVWRNPEEAGALRPRMPYGRRILELARVWDIVILLAVVLGGIYGGYFTPTEASAVGAFGAGLIALARGKLTLGKLKEAIYYTAAASAMMFFIVLGAMLYNSFLALTQLPQEAAAYVVELGLDPWLVLSAILVLYLILGGPMDSLSMILLTIPIFFPIVMGLDFGLQPEELAIWFGILVLISVEVGLISPPVGMNLFVIQSMARDVPTRAIFRGVMPFIVSDILRTALLVAFPAITLTLLRWVYG
ncbi:MAG: TRAP transporter large permease [Mesorhizobium sp.]